MNQIHKKILILTGAVLFLIGLLSGLSIQMFLNPRMGLSSHLAAIQGALVLLITGALWKYVQLTKGLSTLAVGSLVYGMYGFWLALTLSAIFGTSEATPIAGAGFSAEFWKEAMVQVILYSATVACLLGAIALIGGFWRGLQNDKKHN